MKFTKRQLTTMVVAGLMGTAFAGASFAADASSSAADLLAMNQDRTAAPDTEKIKTLEAQIAQVQQEIAAANAWWEKNKDIINSYEDEDSDGYHKAQDNWTAEYNKYKPTHDKGPDHLKQLQAALEAAKNGGTVPVAPQPGDEGTPSGSGETAPSAADMKRSLQLAQKNVQHLQELTARVNRDVTEAEAAAKAAPKDETAQERAKSSKAYAEIVQKAMEAAKQAVTKWQQQLKVEVKDESKPFTMPSPAVETGTDIGQLRQELADLQKQLPDVKKHVTWSKEAFDRNGGYANNGASTEVLLQYLRDTQKLSDLQAAIKAKEARISALSSGTGSTPDTGKEETKSHTGEPGSKPAPQPPESKVEPVQPGSGTSQGTVTPETVTQWAKLKAEAEAAEQYYNSEVWAKTYFEEMDKKTPYQNWAKEVEHVDGYIANAKAEMEAKKQALESYAKEKGITADPRTKEAQAAALKKKIAELQEVKKNAASVLEAKSKVYKDKWIFYETFEKIKSLNQLGDRQAYVEALQRKESNVLDTQLQQAEAALKTLDPSGTVTPPPAPPEVKPPSGKTPGVQQSEAEKKYEAAVETWTKAEAARKEKPQDETVRQQAEKAKQEVEAAKTTYLQELTAKEKELKGIYDKAQAKYESEDMDEDGPDQTTIDARNKAKADYEAIEAKIKQVKGASSSPSETKPVPKPPVPMPSVDPAIPKPDPEADKKKSAEELKKEIAALEAQLKQAQQQADTAEDAYDPDDQTPEGKKRLQAYEEAHKKVMQIGDVLHAKKAILKEKESSSQPQPPAPKPPKPKVDPGQSGSEPGGKTDPQPPESKVDPVQPGGGTSQGTVTPEEVTQWEKLKAEAEAAEQYYNSEVWAKTYFEEMDKKTPYQNWAKEVEHVDGYIANAKAEMEAKKQALESYAKEKGITADPRTKEAQAAALKKKIAELQEVKKNAASVLEAKSKVYKDKWIFYETFEKIKSLNQLGDRQAYVEALQRKEADVLDTQLQQAEAALKALNSSGTVTPPPAPNPPKPKVDPGHPGSEPGGKTDPQPSAQERQQAEADYKTYINTDEPSLKTLVAWEEEETAQAKEQAEKAGASAEDKQYYEYAKQFQERARQQLAAKQKAIGELKAKYGFKDLQPVVPPAEKKKEYTGDNDTKLSAMQKDLEALRATAQQQQQALQKNGTSYGTVGAVLTTAPDKVDMNLRRQYLQAKQTAKMAQQQYKALLADTNTLRKAMHKEELVENLAQPIFTTDGQVNPSVLKGSSSGQPVPTPAENAQVQENSRRIADNTAKIAALDKRVTQVAQDVKKVGARAAALAGLHPVDDGTAKFSIAASTGVYKGENAMAMGLFYRPTRDILISAGSTVGDEVAYNVGVSIKVGTATVHEKMATSTPTTQELYRVIETLQRHIVALEHKVQQMDETNMARQVK
ncbi:YadA-like family protein [uncultured Megasphaera sp.]|uniref:YadA-like family protein n=1 Tax=uncultured Megasphaera sp. TaxID=165188 RepID=UPI00259BCC6B|nr:YadA-like family protein [uncultured Megasphaera sp.]